MLQRLYGHLLRLLPTRACKPRRGTGGDTCRGALQEEEQWGLGGKPAHGDGAVAVVLMYLSPCSSELSSSTGGKAPTTAGMVLDQSEGPQGASLPIHAVAYTSPTTW